MGVYAGEMSVLKAVLYFLPLAREVLIISVAHCTPLLKEKGAVYFGSGY
jgi:hypothetical protein